MPSQPFIAPLSLTTDDFTLRCYAPGDGAALQVATNSSYEHLRPWMVWATEDQTLEQSEVICRRLAAQYLLNQDFTLGIWIGDELAGGTGFHLRGTDIALRIGEIGMWIRGSYAGQGLGTRVLAAMLEWGFTEWRWERILWRCDTRNIASARVAEHNGMLHEGVLRSSSIDVHGRHCDMHMFALVQADWQARKAGTATSGDA